MFGLRTLQNRPQFTIDDDQTEMVELGPFSPFLLTRVHALLDSAIVFIWCRNSSPDWCVIVMCAEDRRFRNKDKAAKPNDDLDDM